MAQFASAEFTGTSGTQLPTADANWTRHTGSTSGVNAVITDANRVRASASGLAIYYHSGSPSNADYTVQADIFEASHSGNYSAGVVGRLNTGVHTMYMARHSNTTGVDGWQLFKLVSGTATQLGSTSTGGLSTGTSTQIKLRMSGTTIELYKAGEGAATISQTDSAISAAGKAGIRIGFTGSAAPSDTSEYHLDNFSGDDLSATYNDNLTESATLADALSIAQTHAATLAEAATLADAQATAQTHTVAWTESAIPADAITAEMVIAAALTESAPLADAYADALGGAPQTYNDTITETLAAADDYAAGVVMAVTRAESAPLADSLAVAQMHAAALAESAATADALTVAAIYAPGLIEAIAFQDAYAGGLLQAAALAEAATLADAYVDALGSELVATAAHTIVGRARVRTYIWTN